jgi:hypothetical protein
VIISVAILVALSVFPTLFIAAATMLSGRLSKSNGLKNLPAKLS